MSDNEVPGIIRPEDMPLPAFFETQSATGVPVCSEFDYTEDGAPFGGTTNALWLGVCWQRGPLQDSPTADRKVANGAFVEDVIVAATHRLMCYQASRFACDENAQALVHLQLALDLLNSRTARRTAAGTEGTLEGN